MLIFDEQELKKCIGKIISDKRKSMKLSQEKLAEQLGIKLRTISKIENGHSFPSSKTLCKLSEVFGLPLKAFFDFDKRKKVSKSEQRLDDIFEKIRSGGNAKIEYYTEIFNSIEKKY